MNTWPDLWAVNMSFMRGSLNCVLSSYMMGRYFLIDGVFLEWNLFIKSNTFYKQSISTTNLCKVIFLHLLFVLHLLFDSRGISAMEIKIRASKENMLSRFETLDYKSPFWLLMNSVSMTIQAYCNEANTQLFQEAG